MPSAPCRHAAAFRAAPFTARRLSIALAVAWSLAAGASQALDLQGTVTGGSFNSPQILAGQPTTLTVQGMMRPGGKGCEIHAGLSSPGGDPNSLKFVGSLSAFPATISPAQM